MICVFWFLFGALSGATALMVIACCIADYSRR